MKLEINHRRKNRKRKTHGNTFLKKNKWVNDEIKEEIRQYVKTKDSENTTLQNLWNATKAVLRGKFTAIQAFLRKEGRKEGWEENPKQPNTYT